MRNNIDQKLHLDKEKIESFLFFSLQTAETLLRLSLLKNNTQIINILYTYKILNREDHDGIKIQNLANIVLKILNDNKI
jgi:hypothetical protein